MPARNWKMNLSNNYYTNSLAVITPNVNVPRQVPVNNGGPLNGAMIGRIHNAKPGCSACGKKVA